MTPPVEAPDKPEAEPKPDSSEVAGTSEADAPKEQPAVEEAPAEAPKYRVDTGDFNSVSVATGVFETGDEVDHGSAELLRDVPGVEVERIDD